MSATDRNAGRPAGLNDDMILFATAAALAAAVIALANAGVRGAAALGAGQPARAGGLLEVVSDLVRGRQDWSTAATIIVMATVALAALVGAGIWRLVGRNRASATRIDRAQRHMAPASAASHLTRQGAAQTAARLGVTSGPGLPLGIRLGGGGMLFSSWEDVSVDVCGPRTGKTVARAIPALLAAPGAAIATSNKRDLLDATRGPRSRAGTVWVFDPQQLVDEPVSWYWNPLSFVTDEVRASILAGVLVGAHVDPSARADAFFDTAALDLITDLILAAAVAGRPITQVYSWLSRPNDEEPIEILEGAGYPLNAQRVAGVVHAPEKQRGGVFGSAQSKVTFLTNRHAARWVTPPTAGERRSEFRPADFASSTDTLYLLSKEGAGTAGPVVAALTMAVCDAAEQLARGCRFGRLPVPMVAVLDEAANVCRWRELPNLYSHYGSRGICLMTILQSWSQGVEVWGRDGMRKLWSAANVKVYGGGASEVEFLGELSQLVGEYEVRTTSTSRSSRSGGGGTSTSVGTRRDRVLDVSDLGAMPRGRALVIASGAPPVLVRTVAWMDGPHADEIRESLLLHDPGAEPESQPAARPRLVKS